MVVLGRVTGAFGVMGWVKIEPYTESNETLLQFHELAVKPYRGREWRSMEVRSARVHGDAVIAQLAGIDDRNAALALKGSELGVPREALPAAGEGELYWADLVGLTVVNREGRMLGRVEEVIAHGAHPLLQVKDAAGKARLIPYVAALVDAVDVEARRIDVDWGEDF